MKYNGKYSLKHQLLREGDLNEGIFDFLFKSFEPGMDLEKFDHDVTGEEFAKEKEKVSAQNRKQAENMVDDILTLEDQQKLQDTGMRKVKTWNDLRLILTAIIKKDELTKKLQRAEHEAAGAGLVVKATLTLLTGGLFAALLGAMGIVKDTKEFIQNSTELTNSQDDNEKIETNKYLDSFLLDVGYSQVLDPRVEMKMIRDFFNDIKDEDVFSGDIEAYDASFTDWAEDWIKENEEIAGKVTLTGAEKKGKFTDIDMADFSDKEVINGLNFIDDVLYAAI